MKSLIFSMLLVGTALVSQSAIAQTKTIAETAIEVGNFKTLVAAAQAAGLVDTLNGGAQLTVFAPTDEAFAKIDPETLAALLKPENIDQLTQILTYHVVPGRVNASTAYDLDFAGTVNGQRLPINFRGEGLKVGDANIKVTDVQCSNGVIHVIDSVLMPALADIPTTAQSAGQFNTLLAAVGAAGLADVLAGDGPFTVFAPTDEAFAALPEGTVATLLKPENKQQLVDILKYHVISGRVYDTDAVAAKRAETLLGRGVNIGLNAEGITVNDAKIVARNIDASNGVIHVIDQVLIPSSLSSQEVINTLNSAVERGAPVYNAGQHGQCCDIYMRTMSDIMAAGINNADARTMSMIQQTVNRAKNTHSMTERAWVLREGIDSLYARMGQLQN
ncbi:MAG: fasciclin domain-containing protein [Planctomycetaceae bacterium]|nr:fasciclin domain-containing protein [Planctomycetaceae bacterium]MCP4462527.1 fasciclin domain-containing protein [Planctomycetaceae bacterium]MDG1809724.1 fasciclin domain-containing protein [Pirellulaceae bacterium]